MLRELQKQLGPVRSRLKHRRVAAALATGLVLGGWLAVVAGLMALLGRSYWAGMAAVVALVSVPLAMVLRALVQPVSWNDAARAVDRHFQLQDRATTAIHLAERPSGDPFDTLQIDDAQAKLAALPLRQAVALDLPWQPVASGVLLSVFAMVLVAASAYSPNLRRLRGSRPVVVEQTADDFQRETQMPAVDASMARRGIFAAPQQRASEPTFVGDVAGRYFDRLQTP